LDNQPPHCVTQTHKKARGFCNWICAELPHVMCLLYQEKISISSDFIPIF